MNDPFPGPRATLRDVADLSEVHISTASRALNPTQYRRVSAATVAKVRAAAADLGYTAHLVAAGLKRGTTKSVGVLVADFDNPYIGPLIRGVAAVLDEHGFVSLIAETTEDPKRLRWILRHLVGRRVDAIVTTAARYDDAGALTRLFDAALPVVLAVRDLPGSGLPAVTHDDFHGGELAAQHLIDLAHQAVAQLRGPPEIDSFVRRRDGFASRVAAHEPIADVTVADHGRPPTREEGYRQMQLTLAQERLPTGVFAHNDVMAIGALEAVRDASLRCPEDISIVGYNDVPLGGNISPGLTTIRLPGEQLGRLAGEMALALIAGEPLAATRVTLPAAIVVRQSTVPANDRG